MQLRHYILATALMTGALLLLGAGNSALAQPYPMQPLYMAPGISTTRTGMFYFNAGVRYRNIQTSSLSREQRITFSGTQGTPPFGPDDGVPVGDPAFGTPVPFGTGTGNTGLMAFPLAPIVSGDPRLSGIWNYQNGIVSADDTGNTIGATCPNPTPPPANVNCPGYTENWPDATRNLLLGRHQYVSGLIPACVDCPVTLMVGYFTFNDPVSQTDNPDSVSGTTRISWQWTMDGTYNATFGAASGEVASLIASMPRPAFGPIEFQDRVWCPSFEAGVQFGSFFDVYGGFSFYNTGSTVSTTLRTQGQMGRRAFIDSFPFSGDQPTVGWTIAPFSSEFNCIGGDCIFNYQISVNGELRGMFPTRTFIFQALPGAPPEEMDEAITQRADFNVYEFRFGGRSWIPLYGMGRFGVFAGTLASHVWYKIAGSEIVTSLGPNFPGETLYTAFGNQSDTAWSFGVFGGSDVEIGFGRWFAKGSVEYSAAQGISYSLLSTDTSFRPSGFQAAISGGIGF